jgi:hypothetical protein
VMPTRIVFDDGFEITDHIRLIEAQADGEH